MARLPREGDTIAARATGAGKGAVGIVRVSGPKVPEIAASVLGMLPMPRTAAYRTFRSAQGIAIDSGVALYFPAPHSYTGEDVLELQGHGGEAVLWAVLRRVVDLGCRLAEPGEFTQRAFLNGKLDLVQAEAVADLIDAGTEVAAQAAAQALAGALSGRAGEIAKGLLDLRVLVEAYLDFPEEDLGAEARGVVESRLSDIHAQLAALLVDCKRGVGLRQGVRVVLVGAPNVGKSSLMNRLSGEDVAIVSAQAGTTRDAVRQHVRLGGLQLELVDTAGIREAGDELEGLGMQRSVHEIGRSDVVVLVGSAVDTWDTALEESVRNSMRAGARLVRVRNKCDLAMDAAEPADAFRVSAHTGGGVEALRDALGRVGSQEEDFVGEVVLARERHVVCVDAALGAVRRAKDVTEDGVLVAEELRGAQIHLAELTGEVTVEDVLGGIFSSFCIGK